MDAETATWSYGRSWGGQGHVGMWMVQRRQSREILAVGYEGEGSNKDNSQLPTTGRIQKSVSNMRNLTWFGNHN